MNLIRYCIMTAFLTGALCLAAEDVSPWDLWRQGYTSFEKGESARDRGDHVQALEYFRAAEKSYRAVQKARPNWNQNVINSRIVLCEQEIADAQKLLGKSAGTAASPSAQAAPSRTASPDGAVRPRADADTLASELVKMQAELAQYKQKLYATLVEVEDLRRQALRGKNASAEMENMLRERRVLEEKYRLLETRCKNLEAQAARPSEELAEANRKLIEMRINLETGERKLELARGREQTQIRENAELMRERGEIKVKLESAERRLADAEKEVGSLRDIRRQAAQEKNAALQKLAETEKLLAAAQDRLKGREEELATLDRRLQEAVKSRGASAALSSEIAAENERLRKQAADAYKAAENSAAEVRALQNQLRESRIAADQLNASLRSLDDRRTQAVAEVKVMREQVEKVTADRKLAAAENANLADRNRKLEEAVRALSDQLDRSKKRLAVRENADRAAAEALASERTRLADQVAALKLKVAEAKVDAEAHRKRLETVTSAAAELRTEYLKTKAQALSAEQEVKRTAGVAAERDRLKAELATLQRNFAALQIEKQDLMKIKQQQEAQAPEFERLQKTAARIAEIERQNQEFSDRNAKLTRRAESAEAASAQLRRQRDEALAGTAKAQQELAAAESAVLVMRRQNAEAEARRQQWQKTRADLEKHLAAARQARDELEKRLAAAPSPAASGGKASAGRKELAGLEREEQQARAEIQAARERLAKLRAEAEKEANAEKERIAALRRNAEAEAEKIQLQRRQAENEAEKVRIARLQADTEAEQVRLKRQREATAQANLELQRQMDAAVTAAQAAAHAAPSSAAAASVQTAVPAAEKLSAKQIEKMLSAAATAEKEDSPKVARWNYRKVLESEPANFEANFGMGRLELAEEEFGRAAAYLQQAHIARESRPDVRIAYARALLGQKKYGNALALLDGCPPPVRKRFDWLLARGRALAGAGRTAQARQSLLAAHRLSPKNGRVLLELARLPVDARNEAAKLRAAKWYERAKKLGVTPDPELEKSLGKLINERTELIDFMSGAALEAEKHRDWNSAVWYYGQLRELDQESGFYAERAARYCFLQKKFAEALKMLADRPTTPRGEWLRAASLLGSGQTAEAEKVTAALREIRPDKDLAAILQPLTADAAKAGLVRRLCPAKN